MPSKEELLRIVNDLSQESIRNEVRKFQKRRYSAIYYLFDNDEIVYVGQSRYAFGRIRTHIREGKKQFNRFALMNTREDLLNQAEAEEIVAHDPKYNREVCLPLNDVYMTIRQMEKRFKIDYMQMKRIVKTHGGNPVFQLRDRRVRYYDGAKLISNSRGQ